MKRLLLLLNCFWVSVLAAQTVPPFYRVSDVIGLSGRYFTSTAQDGRGFVWIAANSGLYRYDGHQLLHINKDLKSNFVFTGIGEMITDGKGDLWILENEKVGVLNTTTFVYRLIPTTPEQKVLKNRQGRLIHLCKDLENRVYLTEANYGVAVFDSLAQKFVQRVPFKLPAGWPVSRISQDPLTRDYLIASDSGLAVYCAKTNEVYTHRYNPLRLPVLQYDVRFASTFFVDAARRYWTLYWSFDKKFFGVNTLCVDERKGVATADTTGVLHGIELGQFFEDSKAGIWLTGGTGLFYEGGGEHRFRSIPSDPSHPYTMSYTFIWNVMEDREKNIWLSTDKGLYVYYRNATTTFNHFDPRTNANALYEAGPNEIWVGHWGGGIQVFDSTLKLLKVGRFRSPEHADPDYDMVWCFQRQASSNMLWAGCQHGNLLIADLPSRQTRRWLHPAPFANATVRQIRQDKGGNLWFCTQKGGVLFWKNGSSYADSAFRVVANFNCIIHALMVDDKNNVWVGTEDQGVYVINGYSHKITHHFTSFDQPPRALTDSYVRDIVQLSDTVYAVLGNNLNLVNLPRNTVRIVDAAAGLPNNDYKTMVRDNDGYLWLMGFGNVSSYNFRKEVFSSYGLKDGLTLTGAPVTSLLSSGGKIYVAGYQEMNAFYPGALQKEEAPPPVVLTAFRFFDRYLGTDSLQQLKTATFAYDQSSFTLSFSALRYALNDRLTYYYKLQGADKEWTRVNGTPTVSYSLLPPGRYTFMVRCVNEKGEVGPVTSLSVHVRQPFWFTWWFIVLVAATVAALIYFLHRLNIKRLMAVENVRQRVARDLHDDMGSTLSTINILSMMAKTKLVEDPVKTSEYISKISDNSSRMMEAMDDIVWSINPFNDSMSKVLTRMLAFATEVLEAKNAALAFDVQPEVENVNLDMEQRRDFFLVFKEIINNAAKYSGATAVNVNIGLQKSWLHLTVRDNGVGFVVDEADSGNGLNNMQRRAVHLRGEISIQSQPGHGTAVDLRVPVG